MSEADEIAKAGGTHVSFIMPHTDALGSLEDMEADFSLNIKYKTKEKWGAWKDRPIRAFYMGMKEIPNEDGEVVNCGVFVSQSECFISGQMTLIEAVSRIEPNTPVEVTFRGSKNNKSSKGSTMIFDVVKLK